MAEYIELYKKHRPRCWEDVVGQDDVVKSLRRAVIKKEIPTGYLFSGIQGTGKALHENTPIPTPTGFKRLKDIKVGDLVFAPTGEVTTVITKYCPFDKDMYLITFDNGEKVRSAGGHLWTVTTAKQRKRGSSKPIKPITLETREMVKDFLYKGRKNYAIQKSQPVAFESKTALPVHPYILGLWLGDGDSTRPYFYKGKEDIEAINTYLRENLPEYELIHSSTDKRSGAYICRIAKNGISIKSDLVKLGLIGNKHIPEQYIYTSRENRLQLIRGLLDTDGTVEGMNTKENKKTRITFGQFGDEKKQIVDSVKIILGSLGYKVFSYQKKVTTRVGGTKTFYHIAVSVGEDNKTTPLFNLERKRDKVGIGQTVNLKHFIKDIKKIEDDPSKYFCIGVDHPSHLFLCTKSFIPTHNTTLALILAKALNCSNVDEAGNPCNCCPACKAIDSDSQLGVKYISMANYGSAEDVRRLMEESRIAQPIKKKVYILDEMQNMSSAAQDSMLIGLESESQETLFIGCTTEPDKIKPAILSRLQHRRLNRPSMNQLAENLVNICKKEKGENPDFPVTKAMIMQAVKSAGGSVRDSVRNLETLVSGGTLTSQFSVQVIETLLQGVPSKLFSLTNEISKKEQSFVGLAEDTYKDLSSMLIIKAGADPNEFDEVLVKLAEETTGNLLLYILDELGKMLMQVPSKKIDSKILFDIFLTKVAMYIRKSKEKK